MYGYIYLTTNLINNRKYIGKHKSSHFDESYKGSGKILKQAFEKYGWENFKVELLKECDSEGDLNDQEIFEIERYSAVTSKEYYNIASGGEGWSSQWNSPELRDLLISKLKGRHLSLSHRNHISLGGRQSYLSSPERRQAVRDQMKGNTYRLGKFHNQETRDKMSKSHQGVSVKFKDYDKWYHNMKQAHQNCSQGENNPMYGRHHSELSKQMMSQKRSIHNTGCVWINNGEVTRFIKSEELEYWIQQGFVRGRRIKSKSSTTIESITEKKSLSE